MSAVSPTRSRCFPDSRSNRPRSERDPMRLIDSHCHLQADRFDADADLVLGGARLAGVERILVPGWDRASGERSLAFAERFPWLDAAAGASPPAGANVDDAA